MRRERQSGVPSDRGSSCDICCWELGTDHAFVGMRWRIVGGDVHEVSIACDGPLEPAACQCDGIGDREGYGDEFKGFEGTPEAFEIAQTGREQQQGQEELEEWDVG